MLEKEAEWVWTLNRSNSFKKIKEALSKPPVLRFYDVNAEVTLQADESSYALGAAIRQEAHPVAYASRSLTKAERNYPQIKKKSACNSFRMYEVS